ncbi:MAG: glycosyltransferase family 39 protein [Phormidesmis sp.]
MYSALHWLIHRLTRWAKPLVTPEEWRQSWSLVAVLVIAAALRFYQLGEEGLWVDEMMSLLDADHFWEQPRAHRPLYFILLNLWLRLGSGDVWLRSLAVVFGIGSVWLIYRLGHQLLNRQTGLIAALLMALSPLFINHSQEIRMYSLSSFLSLAGTLALSQGLSHTQRSRPQLGPISQWVISRWLAILTTPLNLLLLLPDAILVSYRWWRRPRTWRRFFAGGIVILIGSLPTLLTQITGGATERFLESQVADYSRPGLLQIFGMVTQFSLYWPLRYLLEGQSSTELANDQLDDTQLLGHFFSYLNGYLLFYAALTLILLGLLGFSLMRMRRRRSFGEAALVAWALVPSVAMLAVSYRANSVWFPRYLLGFAPYYLLLIATGFVQLSRWPKLKTAIAALYIIGVGGSLKDYYGPFHYRNHWQRAAEIVERSAQSGDVVVYYSLPLYYEYSFPRYYRGEASLVTIDRPPTVQHLEPDYIRQQLSGEIASRVWVVCWWYCEDLPGINSVAETLLGEPVSLAQQVSLESLENEPIGISLFTQADAHSLEKVDGRRK